MVCVQMLHLMFLFVNEFAFVNVCACKNVLSVHAVLRL
jgi:hypothetical protein